MLNKPISRILVTGAAGQIGTELTAALRKKYGADHVVAGGYQTPPDHPLAKDGILEEVDVTSPDSLSAAIKRHRIDTIFHLAALLSAVGEDNPQLAWQVNAGGTLNVLEAARHHELSRVIVPSSIAVFGAGTPAEDTPQQTILRPSTMYGITKVTGELLGDYFVNKYQVDVRGVRFPGIISSETPPGGGTTDYAVDIYYQAVQRHAYECFVKSETMLPMMYMPDALRALMELAEADQSRLSYPNAYNVTAMSFSAGELADAIRAEMPDFTCTFEPDHRQAIADTWPRSLDDSDARRDWDWQPEFDLPRMTKDMLARLTQRLLTSP